jgi:hypothetical protein
LHYRPEGRKKGNLPVRDGVLPVETGGKIMTAESMALLIPVVSIIAVFTFVAIAAWSENRRKERETFHRHETYRKMMDHPGDSADAVLQLMRHRESQEQARRIEGLRLGGMITFVAGIGAMILLYFLVADEPVYLAGIIPALIGLVLMLYGFLMAKKPEPGQQVPRS